MQKIALVVDDSRVARMVLRKILIPHQFEIIEFASAEEAIGYLQSENTLPTIIFMDVMMEGMDGLTATQKIKATSHLATIPVVICTGSSSDLDKGNALAAGAVAVLAKPPEPVAVLAILNKLVTVSTPAVKATAIAEKSAMTEKVVAIIEQKLLPKINHDIRGIAEEVSRKIASEIISEQLPVHVQAVINTLLPSVKEQLLLVSKQDSEQLAQQLIQQGVSDALAARIPQAVNTAAAELDISQQVSDSVAEQAERWLNGQEQQLQHRFNTQIQQYVVSSIDQHLDGSLAAMIAPLVTLQVDEQLAQQLPQQQDDESLELAKRVSKLNRTVMGLGLVIFVLAVIVIL